MWSQRGGWIEAEGDGFGNEFGASVAWTGDDSLAIGAPGAVGGQGRVYTASLSGGEGGFWFVGPPLSADFSGSPPPSGAQLGFAVAFDDSTAGDGRLVAGAPGASRRYSWGPGVFGNPGVAQFDVTWNMGSAVDISGDLVVTGGISDRLRVNVNETLPVQRANTTDLGPVVPAGPLNATVNDYLDIEGQNVAVSRGGGGGRVELYGINGLLTLESLTTYAPPATAGDLVGWAIELDGRSLIAGAPGTNAQAGAVFSTEVPVVATWIGNSFEPFSDPANWDIGVVPGPGDTAIVPGSIVGVDVDAVVGRLVVDGFAQVYVENGFSLESGSTLVRVDGSIEAAPGGEVVLRNDVLVDGSITAVEGGGVGLLTLDGDVAVSGTGTILVLGGLEKTGPGTATVDVDQLLTAQTTAVSVSEGTLELTGADLRDGRDESELNGLVGAVSVAAGAELRVVGDLQLTNETSIGVDIDGDSTSTGNYGRVTVTGTLTKDGALDAVLAGYAPTPADSYDVITCLDCTDGTFASTSVSPLEVTTTLTTVTLALAPTGPCTTTWTGAAGNGIFTDPSSWTAGVPDGADVACLDGTPAEDDHDPVSASRSRCCASSPPARAWSSTDRSR